MTRTENTKLRIVLTILLGAAAVISYYFILGRVQHESLIDVIRKEMEETAAGVKQAYPNTDAAFLDITTSMDFVYEGDLDLVAYFARKDEGFKISDSWLKDYNFGGDYGDLIIADRDGSILASASGDHSDIPDEIRDSLLETYKTGEFASYKPDVQVPAKNPDEEQEELSLSSDDYTVWYAKKLDEDHALILKVKDLVQMAILYNTDAWSALLSNKPVGTDGFVFVWSDDTKKILYYPETRMKYHSIDELGVDPDKIGDGEFGWHDVNGKKMFLYTTLDPETGVWIACAVPERELENSNRFTIGMFCIAFALLVAALVYYVILLLLQKRVKVIRDFTGGVKESAHKSRQYKLLILTIVMLVILFLFQFYLQTLYLMSSWAESASAQTDRIEKSVSIQERTAKGFNEIYESEKKLQFNALAHFLALHPDQCTSSVLDEFSYIVEANDIQILDDAGNSKTTTSSMAYPPMMEADTETYDNLTEAVAVQDNGKSAFDWMSKGRRVILPMTELEGESTGYLYAQYYSRLVDMALKGFDLNGTLSRVQPGNGGFAFAVDADSKKFTYHPDETKIGKDALEYGLTEDQIKDNYSDFITINGVAYYAVTDTIGSDVVFYTISRSNLLGRRVKICLMSIIAAAILLFVTGLALYTSREQIEIVQPEEGRHTIRDDQTSPEYRTIRVLKYYTVIAAALIAVYSILRESNETGGVIGYVLGGNWQHGLNVFALCSSVIILSRGGVVLFCFSRLVQVVGNILPIRGGTILKMLGSLLTYLAVAYLLYRCMVCFGLNPTALMASAGIVSVVLGIGANSLVGDILAGIFLLMEGNIQVGDVVQIGDFRGYVMELGIRMTKLFDMDMDDVKIIPNNEVRNVVHMTMRTSIVYSDFQIRYEEKLESVEKILKDELKNAKHSPLILDGPVYIGVRMLDSSGVVLRTATRCHEPCRRKVEREVNHIVYSIFQKNHISVPYPQVTLHEGDDSTVER